MSLHRAPAYDQSFFRKNNIIARCHTIMSDNAFHNHQHGYRHRHFYNSNSYKKIAIDIMVIPDHIPLEKVVTNFDLTFCQVWWDGEKLESYDVDDVRNKSGSLNPDYLQPYLEINQFIIKRLYKYKNRGFQIKIDVSGVTENIVTKTEKTFDKEQWVLTSLVNYILDDIILDDIRVVWNIDLQPTVLSLSSIYNLYGKDIVDAYIISFYVNRVIYYPQKYKSVYDEAFSYIMVENSQQRAEAIIVRWKTEKINECRQYKEYLRKLREDFKKANQTKISNLTQHIQQHIQHIRHIQPEELREIQLYIENNLRQNEDQE
jgi:hypothetical protein